MTQHHRKHSTATKAGPVEPPTLAKAAIISRRNRHNGKSVADEQIRICAYQKWEAAGKPTGDGIQFWLEAEQELIGGKNEKFVQRGEQHGHREHERLETVKDRKLIVDSHYRDKNRMFQSHGERGHRHGGG
jgi:hypothetical protein